MKTTLTGLRNTSFGLVLGLAWLGAGCAQPGARPTALATAAAAAKADRMQWFNEARFGLFLHWGLYAVPAGEYGTNRNYAEWIQLSAKIPNRQYEQYATQFHPVEFDAREWVRVAKAAGMKYIVITAKHHDGFCMYDTRLTGYNIVKATPFHRDPMKDLARECRKAGLKFCFYYSIPDWHHPEFPAKYSQRGFHGDPNPEADLDKYVAYLKGQVRELLTGYGPVGILWFDDGGAFKNTMENRTNGAVLIHAREILDEIHQLQPACLVNNRLGLPADYLTPEQRIPTNGFPGTNWETCMTLNRHWGYNKYDQNWKPPRDVIRNLVDIASKGGNYLLNIGPTAEGTLPPESVRILTEVGRWMAANGESIYGTSASPLATTPDWGRATRKGNRLYLHVFRWPEQGDLVLSGVALPRKAYLLADPQQRALSFGTSRSASGPLTCAINLPPQPPDPIDTVVVLETD